MGDTHHEIAVNAASVDRSNPFAYGRARAHLKIGLFNDGDLQAVAGPRGVEFLDYQYRDDEHQDPQSDDNEE